MNNKSNNFAATRPTFVVGQKLPLARQQKAQEKAHDFLAFLDPKHETPRRILNHLSASIALNDFGATAFCLRSLFEGMTNLLVPQLIGNVRIQNWIPSGNQTLPNANSELRNWLLSKHRSLPTSVRPFTKRKKNSQGKWRYSGRRLIVSIDLKELQLLSSNTSGCFLRPTGFDVAIPCFWTYKDPSGSDVNKPLGQLKSLYTNGLQIDPHDLAQSKGKYYLEIQSGFGKEIRLKEIQGRQYAEVWFGNKQDTYPFQFSSLEINGVVEALNIPRSKKKRAIDLLESLYPTRNAYVHDFAKLQAVPMDSTLLAIEYFDLFEPIFLAMKKHS